VNIVPEMPFFGRAAEKDRSRSRVLPPPDAAVLVDGYAVPVPALPVPAVFLFSEKAFSLS
jgi:hypothetical protein